MGLKDGEGGDKKNQKCLRKGQRQQANKTRASGSCWRGDRE